MPFLLCPHLSILTAGSLLCFPYERTLSVLAVYEGTGCLQEAVLLLCKMAMPMKLNRCFLLKIVIL